MSSTEHISAEELIAQESGARSPQGLMSILIEAIALSCSLYHPLNCC